jgi:acyl-CoA thioesterase-1
MIRSLWIFAMALAVLPLSFGVAVRAEPSSAAPAILILGDSLSAAYGIDIDEGWVRLLEERLKKRGLNVRVVNASISGETTAGGLGRLPALLVQHRPAVLVIQLGANDGLRGLSLDALRGNLVGLVQLGRKSGSRILLVGIQLPPNYGAAFNDGFQAVFRSVAASQQVPLVPSLLTGVAEDWSLMQADGLHPTAQAQPRILDNVWPELSPLLASEPAAKSR